MQNTYALSLIDTAFYYILTPTGIYNYAKGVLSSLPIPFTGSLRLYSFSHMADSSLLITLQNYGVQIFKNNKWERFDSNMGNSTPYAACEIAPDSLAITYINEGISIGTKNQLTNYKGSGLDEIYRVKYFNNTLYMSSVSGHVNQYSNSTLKTMGTNPAFYSSLDLKVSAKNKLYSCGKSGIFCLENKNWESALAAYNLPETVYHCMAFDTNNTLYAGGNLGLYISDTLGNVQHYNAANSPINNVVWSICLDSKNRLWVGSLNTDFRDGELHMLENGEFTNKTISGYRGTPKRIIEDHENNIWVGYFGTSHDSTSSLVKIKPDNSWEDVDYD